MSKKYSPRTVGEVFGRRVAEARDRRKWTQKELAARVGMRRETVTMIELGKRRVTIEEWLAIAAALNAPPLHLIVPLEDDALVEVGKRTHAAKDLRAWIRGLSPLNAGGRREVVDFLAEWPDSELESDVRDFLTRGANPVLVMLADQEKLDERASDLAWEVKVGEFERRKKQSRKEKDDG
jgi:transcriptional regulator with XRE-family HTH domain